MKNFMAVSFYVLAVLASSTKGDATWSPPGADGFARANGRSQPANSQYEIESDTNKRCCYIADIEMFLPILFNGTESLKREATALITHITRGCKGEPDTISNGQSTHEELRKRFNLEDTEDILEDERILKRKINMHSCNVGDYIPLLQTLMNGTDDEKLPIYDLLMISIERCNAEFRPGDKQYRHCALDRREKWHLFLKWMVNRYMDRSVSGRKRVSAQDLL